MKQYTQFSYLPQQFTQHGRGEMGIFPTTELQT